MPVFAEVDLDDMAFDEETATYSYPCRCSDKFVVSEEELEQGVDTLGCNSCTFVIKLQYEKNE
jgi:hypothetical protein